MATNNTGFTQDMIDSLKGVAQKFGGMDNPNFQSVVNSKYGLGAFDAISKPPVAPVVPAPNTSLSPATPNKPIQPIVQAPDTEVPVVPTAPADIAWNAKQAEFDKANPVGTAMPEVKYTAPVTATPAPATTPTATPAKPAEVVNPDVRTQEINANLTE